MVKAIWLVKALFLCCKLHILQSSVWAELIIPPCQNSHLHVNLFTVKMIYNILSIWKFLYALQAPDKVLKSWLQKNEWPSFPYPTSWTANHQHQSRLQLAPVIISFFFNFNFNFNTRVTWSFRSSLNSNMQCNRCWLLVMFQSILLNSTATKRQLKGNVR